MQYSRATAVGSCYYIWTRREGIINQKVVWRGASEKSGGKWPTHNNPEEKGQRINSSQTHSFLQKQRIHWGTLIAQTPREQSTGIPHFIVLHFVTLWSCLHFLNIKVCGNPALSDDGLSFLSMKYFLIKVHSFFRQYYCTLNRLQYSVHITFICTGKPKYLWLTLLWYLLYCTGLEQNPQYFRGMPTEWRESE